MQLLAALLFIVALTSFVSVTEGSGTSLRTAPTELAAQIDTAQFEMFAQAAWPLAHAGATGVLARSAMQLPAAFTESPAASLHAWSDGSYLYVWSDNTTAAAARPDAVLAGAQPAITQVGISNAAGIAFRDGSSGARPTIIPFPVLVARMRL